MDPAKGRVSYDINIQEAGEYRVWTRMQAGNSYNNSVWLKVDNNCPINVGDKSVPSSSWKWVDYKNGSTGSKIDVTLSSGSHTLRYFGKEKNVKVDTVVLLKGSNCTPSGEDGKNCQIIPSTNPDDSDGGSSGAGSTSGDSGSTAKPSKPVKVGDTIITAEGEQVAIEGEDEGGSYYTDKDTGEKVYAEEELSDDEAAELGYLAQTGNRMPWFIGLGVVIVLSIGAIIYTAVRPEQAKHIVAYQHRFIDKIKSFFNRGGHSSGGGTSSGDPTIVYPAN